MRHFKHYCKLIFSTLAVVLVFAFNSLSAHADPLTGAMLAAGFADGFAAAGFGAASASSISSILSNVNYTDIVPWSDIVLAGKAYLTIRDLIGSNNVEIEVPSEISNAGYYRIEQMNRAYGLAPGTFHTVGSFPAYKNYVFSYAEGGYKYGPIFGVTPQLAVSDAYDQTFSIDSDIYIHCDKGTGVYQLHRLSSIFSNTYNSYQSNLNFQNHFTLKFQPSDMTLAIGEFQTTTLYSRWISVASSDITTLSPQISRASDSVIEVPNGKINKVVVPASVVSGISYTDGEPVTAQADVESIFDAIAEAFVNQQIVSSEYEAGPAPTPTGDTISETAYSVLNDTFDEFKEFFGDIYDGITDFQESFGDWVDNVASGWTEVFGDIYDGLIDFHESFGDFVNDVASGWTEVFGDIYSTVSGIASTVSGTIANTLSGIASAVSSLVESIENADFQFIDAFWKNFITPFNNLFNTIKSHLSIWHYVVEWLASISSVFTFYLGVMSGAGSGFLLPIYACFAGTVVLAVYKRFGK